MVREVGYRPSSAALGIALSKVRLCARWHEQSRRQLQNSRSREIKALPIRKFLRSDVEDIDHEVASTEWEKTRRCRRCGVRAGVLSPLCYESGKPMTSDSASFCLPCGRRAKGSPDLSLRLSPLALFLSKEPVATVGDTG